MIPYMRWYSSDYLASSAIRQFTLEEEAVYRRLLDLAWDRGPNTEGETPPVLPNDPEELAWALGIEPRKFRGLWNSRVEKKFTVDGDELYNERQFKEYERAKAFIEERRASGRRGGKVKKKAQLEHS